MDRTKEFDGLIGLIRVQLCVDLKEVYGAVDKETAKYALKDFGAKGEKKYGIPLPAGKTTKRH